MKTNLITRQDAAEICGISTRTLDRYVKQRRLKAHKRGRATMFTREDIQSMVHAEPQPQVTTTAINNLPQPAPDSPDITRQLDGLVEVISKMHSELTKKQTQISQLNFELGQAQEKLHHSVPLLSAQNDAHTQKNAIVTLHNKLGRQRVVIYALVAGLALIIAAGGVGLSFFLQG